MINERVKEFLVSNNLGDRHTGSFTWFCLMWTVCDMQRASCLCAF